MRSPLFSSLKVPDLFQHLLVQNLQPSLNVFFRHELGKPHMTKNSKCQQQCQFQNRTNQGKCHKISKNREKQDENINSHKCE